VRECVRVCVNVRECVRVRARISYVCMCYISKHKEERVFFSCLHTMGCGSSTKMVNPNEIDLSHFM
jgi:hypothetical protein